MKDSKYKPEMCDQIKQYLADGDSKVAACARLGVGRATFYEWCNPEHSRYKPELAEAVAEGVELAQLFWEDELKKATLGVNPNANPTLMIFTMKNRFKEQWSDMHTVNHSIKRSAEDMSDDELAAIAGSGRASEEAES